MFKTKKVIYSYLSVFTVLFFSSACTLLPETIPAQQHPKEQPPEHVAITALELAQLKDAVMQWQQAKSGIERLLKLEKEITFLVDHIDIINSKAIEQQAARGYKNRPLYASLDSGFVPMAMDTESKNKPVIKSPEKRVFALQVASVDSMKGAHKTLKTIAQQAAPLFRADILTNVEVAQVNNKTFYRLKISSYASFAMAKNDCKVLKRYKLACIVSNYTDNPITL
jgi:hypothetical protein